MSSMPITAVFTGILALMLVGVSVRVTVLRAKNLRGRAIDTSLTWALLAAGGLLVLALVA